MGIPISAPVVHSEYDKTEFRANGLGGWLLDIISMLSVLILPFVIGFSMGQFWKTFATVVVEPTAVYNGKYLVQARALDGTDYLWASSDSLQGLLQGDERAMNPYFSYLMDDVNSDGRPDLYTFTFMMPLRTASPISVFHFVPEFQYSFTTSLFTLNMTAAPWVSLAATDVTLNGSSGFVFDGELAFGQTKPIDASGYTLYDVVYQHSYLELLNDVNDIVNTANIGRRYAMRNQTANYIVAAKYATNDLTGMAPPIVPGDSNDIFDLFTVSVHMRVIPAQVNYLPSFAESLKQGWIEYFVIAYVIYWAFGIIRKFFVTQALINTVAEVRRFGWSRY